ncbi:hypothetical protein RRF57_008653 [Xylaria bambusicola]|uniref:Uncharacterized protein n=1 Tax=Xylaria bambusicola TaxID=326684 RepID=A0AAN7UYC5_9PEZI
MNQNKTPIAKAVMSADEGIVHLFREDLGSLIFNARPPPQILIAAIVAGELKDTGCGGPQDR